MSVCAPLQIDAQPRVWVGILLGEGKRGGVRIEGIVPESPASRSALAAGDEVLTVDGVAVHAAKALSMTLGGSPIGKKVTLGVLHEGRPRNVVVTPAARPSDEELIRQRLLGKPAPAFMLPRVGATGEDTLASHRGRPLLIDFWATWCGPCVHSLPELAHLEKQHAGTLDVIGISTEPAATLLSGITEFGIAHPVLSDVTEDVTRAYGIFVLPTMVLVDGAGVVRHVEVGANVEGMAAAVDALLAHP
ncbi:MAG: redoxin family protein [Polyangia bacterium]